MRVTIRVKSDFLDLNGDIDRSFSISKAAFDLGDFSTRNSGFTSRISIPVTDKNRILLSDVTTELECSVFIDGFPVLQRAKMVVDSEGIDKTLSQYNATIFFDNYNFFNLIVENELDKLNLADLNLNWDVATLGVLAESTTDLVYPICDWFDRTSKRVVLLDPATSSALPKYNEIHTSGFFIYCKSLMERIAEETGFTLDFDEDINSEFDQLALACPMDWFSGVDSEGLQSYIGWSAKTANQNSMVTGDRLTYGSIQLGGGSNPQWSTINHEFTTGADGEYKVSLDGTYNFTNYNDEPTAFDIVVYRNLIEVYRHSYHKTGNNVDFYLRTDIDCLNTDLVYFEVEVREGTTLDVLTLGNTRMQSDNYRTEIIGVRKNVQPQDYIPKINKKEFFASILNLYNLVITTDPLTKTVYIKPFNNLYDTVSYGEPEFILDESKGIERDFKLPSLAQENHFKWQEDNLLKRDANYIHHIRDKFLPEQNSIVEMPFSACDNSTQFFDANVDTYLKAKVPVFNTKLSNLEFNQYTINIGVAGAFTINTAGVEFDVGDFFTVWVAGVLPGPSYRKYRVIQKTSDVAGTCEIPLVADVGVAQPLIQVTKVKSNTPQPRLAIIRSDGGEVNYYLQEGTPATFYNLSADALTANWMDTLKGENIYRNTYSRVFESLENPQVIKAWFKVDLSTIESLDYLKPLYVPKFGADFYINKIEQFKANGLARLELIKIEK